MARKHKAHNRKAGDTARIIKNNNMHGYEIGEGIRILECVDNGNYPFYNTTSVDPEKDTVWAVADEELEDIS